VDTDAKPTTDANVYEMLWDCKFCGSKKLLGKTHRHCPNCGGLQDPSWRYFPSDTEKVAVKDHIYYGADKICPACQTPTSAKAEFCGNCGSPLDRAANAQLAGERRKDEGATFDTEDRKGREEAAKQPIQAAPTPAKHNNRLLYILGGVAVLVIGAILFSIFSTRTASAYVTGYRWEREIRINSLQAFTGSSSCSSVPVGAYNVDQRYEQTGSRQVADGQTCDTVQVDQGDGTFREERQCETNYRSEAVYDYVCYYSYNQWAYSRSATSQGDMSVAPFWPETRLRTGSCVGCEQENRRDEIYYLVFKGDGDRTFQCPVPLAQWQDTPIETAFNLKVGTVLKDVRCDTLERVR
jgi:hypothetical protein